MLKHLESKDFEKEVLNSEKVILVDFFATWCGPCQMLGPVLENMAPNVDFDIAKVNIDESQELAIKYGVDVVPTMLIFKNGQIVGQLVGYVDEIKIKEEVQKYM